MFWVPTYQTEELPKLPKRAFKDCSEILDIGQFGTKLFNFPELDYLKIGHLDHEYLLGSCLTK